MIYLLRVRYLLSQVQFNQQRIICHDCGRPGHKRGDPMCPKRKAQHQGGSSKKGRG